MKPKAWVARSGLGLILLGGLLAALEPADVVAADDATENVDSELSTDPSGDDTKNEAGESKNSDVPGDVADAENNAEDAASEDLGAEENGENEAEETLPEPRSLKSLLGEPEEDDAQKLVEGACDPGEELEIFKGLRERRVALEHRESLLLKRENVVSMLEREIEKELERALGRIVVLEETLGISKEQRAENEDRLKNVVSTLDVMSARKSSEIFSRLPIELSIILLTRLGPEKSALIISKLEPKQGTTILRRMSPSPRAINGSP